MPKIPMAEKAGLIRHVSDTVHMQGAPDLNWKLGEGQALINMGDQLGRGADRLGNAALEFGRQMQDTEDRLNATRIESLWRDRQSALEARMAENPGDYEKFGEWAQDTDSEFVDASKPFRDKMSKHALDLFDAHMDGIRKEAYHRRQRVGYQARVTADYNLFQAQWKDAALRSDLETCNAMLEQHRGTLISEQEYEQKKLDYERLSAFGEVKRQVEAGAPGIIDKLKEQDGDGNYANYKGLEEAARDRFIRVAEADDAKRRSDENQTLVDRLNSGEQITEEDIDRAFEGQTSPEAVKQKNQQKRIVRQFTNRQKAAQRLSEREARQEAREERRERREAEAEEREKKKGEVNAHEYRLLTYEFSSDPAVRQKQYSDLLNDIYVTYAGDGQTCHKLRAQLNESFKAKNTPDSSYKNTFIYTYGKRKLEDMKGDFYSRYPGRGESWYSFMTNVYNDSDDMKESNLRMAAIAFDNFIRENPEATKKDVDDFLANLKKDVNWAECDKIVEFWRSRATPRLHRSSYTSEEVERIVNGRIAIFGADKKFIRWKDGK